MTNQAQAANQSSSNVSLGLSDLALMANIIQVTSERGAIKANEMQAVGALYSKLTAFVNANTPREAETPSETPKPDSQEK